MDDAELLDELPPDLVDLLKEINGFILHHGALHIRGASRTPEWHSLRSALRGPAAFHALYENVHASDIPFGQDQLGDQFLLREGRVLRLSAETDEVEPLADSLEDFFSRVREDMQGFLNVNLKQVMLPGQLLLASPPFVLQESGTDVSLKPVSAAEVICFHSHLARQIRDVPDGGHLQIQIVD